MAIYRVSFGTHSEGHAGYGYYGSRREAEREAAQWRRDHPDDSDTEIGSVPTPSGKGGWVELLNRWGNHPDNG